MATTKKRTVVKCTCKNCGKEYTKKEIKRIYGEFSAPFLLGYCSAKCFTDK